MSIKIDFYILLKMLILRIPILVVSELYTL